MKYAIDFIDTINNDIVGIDNIKFPVLKLTIFLLFFRKKRGEFYLLNELRTYIRKLILSLTT